MKKRSSKMMAFRQSKMPGNPGNQAKPENEIEFLKNL